MLPRPALGAAQLVAAALLLSSAVGASAQTYRVVELGASATDPPNSVIALRINARDVAVGFTGSSEEPDADGTQAVWNRRGRLTAGGDPGFLFDVNDDGKALGYRRVAGAWEGVVWDSATGTATPLPIPVDSRYAGVGFSAITNGGVVYGTIYEYVPADPYDGPVGPFGYDLATGELTYYASILGSESAVISAASNTGYLTGWYYPSGVLAPYRRLPNGAIENLTPVIGAGATPTVVNDDGDLAGSRTTGSGTEGFAVVGGVVRSIALAGRNVISVSGMNNRGTVVGQASGPTGSTAFVWRAGRIVDLSTLSEVAAAGWSGLRRATGINDRGTIVAYGPKGSRSDVGVMLIPLR